ncbi:MAG: mechanosensitive ion channel family protein [Opitutaceae bacterium]
MDFMENWGNLLAPQDGFKLADMWQVLVVLALLSLYKRLFKAKQQKEEPKEFNPKVWIKINLPFVAQWLTLLPIYLVFSFLIGLDVPILRFFVILGAAWIAIGLLTSLLRERFWAQSVAAVAYLITGLFGLNLVEDSIQMLDELSFTMGDITISAWKILAGIIAFAFTLWVGLAIARIAETQIQMIPRLSASLKVLIAKIVRIVLIAVAIITAIGSIGIDLSAFAFLGGAIGIGLGFGLQKVVSNFVSGIILLMDNSIKPGDVIEIEGTYGWINNLRARYASVITRDGTEHLIPNEDLITQRVINWSFTDDLVRVRVPIGVSYNSDPHHCIQLILDVASTVDRILKSPAPKCLLNGFGDNSVDLELRIWIADPSNGVGSVRSEVLLKIWDSFKEHNIEIPFPQRDLHIRSSEIELVKRDRPDPE